MPAPASARPLARPLTCIAVCALVLWGCEAPGSDREDPPAKPRTTQATKTTETTDAGGQASAEVEAERGPAATLPVEQLAGELIMTKLVGTEATAEELEAIRTLQLGGVILFGPNVVEEPQLRALLGSLQAARSARARATGLPETVLVSVDQEGGPIRNVPFAPPEATQPTLAGGPVAQARQAAADTGAALGALGINMDLGPVADLAAGPNRTMAGRSFGEDAAAVAPYVAATVAGLESGGIAATAKHFPGFGASTANSDEAIAYVDRTRAQLLSEELVPFRAAVRAGVDAIMVSHGIHRGLGSDVPGIIDQKVATGLLRQELGFTGVAMTDSMNARGFREAWGDTVPRACPAALAAGIDLLLLTGSLETAMLCRQRIIEAVREGALPEARVREAARRVTELRARLAAPQARSAAARPSE